MNTLIAPDQANSFRRHAIAVLSANFVTATLVGVVVGVMVALNTHSVAGVLMISSVAWLGIFALAAPASGFLFTLAWPFLRKARKLGLLISSVLGAEGGLGFVWANHAAVGKSASASELTWATLVGGLLGAAYWFTASARSSKTADKIELSQDKALAAAADLDESCGTAA